MGILYMSTNQGPPSPCHAVAVEPFPPSSQWAQDHILASPAVLMHAEGWLITDHEHEFYLISYPCILLRYHESVHVFIGIFPHLGQSTTLIDLPNKTT